MRSPHRTGIALASSRPLWPRRRPGCADPFPVVAAQRPVPAREPARARAHT